MRLVLLFTLFLSVLEAGSVESPEPICHSFRGEIGSLIVMEELALSPNMTIEVWFHTGDAHPGDVRAVGRNISDILSHFDGDDARQAEISAAIPDIYSPLDSSDPPSLSTVMYYGERDAVGALKSNQFILYDVTHPTCMKVFIGGTSFCVPPVPPGTGVHFALVTNGTHAHVYLNGTLAATEPPPIGSNDQGFTGNDPLVVLGSEIDSDFPASGGVVDSRQLMVGVIEELRVWNRPLDPSELGVWNLTSGSSTACAGGALRARYSFCVDRCDLGPWYEQPATGRCSLSTSSPGEGIQHTGGVPHLDPTLGDLFQPKSYAKVPALACGAGGELLTQYAGRVYAQPRSVVTLTVTNTGTDDEIDLPIDIVVPTRPFIRRETNALDPTCDLLIFVAFEGSPRDRSDVGPWPGEFMLDDWWMEPLPGCNSDTTRFWVRAPLIRAGASLTIAAVMNGTRPRLAPNGTTTFSGLFYDFDEAGGDLALAGWVATSPDGPAAAASTFSVVSTDALTGGAALLVDSESANTRGGTLSRPCPWFPSMTVGGFVRRAGAGGTGGSDPARNFAVQGPQPALSAFGITGASVSRATTSAPRDGGGAVVHSAAGDPTVPTGAWRRFAVTVDAVGNTTTFEFGTGAVAAPMRMVHGAAEPPGSDPSGTTSVLSIVENTIDLAHRGVHLLDAIFVARRPGHVLANGTASLAGIAVEGGATTCESIAATYTQADTVASGSPWSAEHTLSAGGSGASDPLPPLSGPRTLATAGGGLPFVGYCGFDSPGGGGWLLASKFTSGPPRAVPVVPDTYRLYNGDQGTFTYHDMAYTVGGSPHPQRNVNQAYLEGGVGLLIDGVLGPDNYGADATRFIGWNIGVTPPEHRAFTFVFNATGERPDHGIALATIEFHVNKYSGGGDVNMWEAVNVSVSMRDPYVFPSVDDWLADPGTTTLRYETTAAERVSSGSEPSIWVTVDLSEAPPVGKYVRTAFDQDIGWIFHDEVKFTAFESSVAGELATEPGGPAAVAEAFGTSGDSLWIHGHAQGVPLDPNPVYTGTGLKRVESVDYRDHLLAGRAYELRQRCDADATGWTFDVAHTFVHRGGPLEQRRGMPLRDRYWPLWGRRVLEDSLNPATTAGGSSSFFDPPRSGHGGKFWLPSRDAELDDDTVGPWYCSPRVKRSGLAGIMSVSASECSHAPGALVLPDPWRHGSPAEVPQGYTGAVTGAAGNATTCTLWIRSVYNPISYASCDDVLRANPTASDGIYPLRDARFLSASSSPSSPSSSFSNTSTSSASSIRPVWCDLSSGSLLGSEPNPGRSCAEIFEARRDSMYPAPSGLYFVSATEVSSQQSVRAVRCDNEIQGGGWGLIAAHDITRDTTISGFDPGPALSWALSPAAPAANGGVASVLETPGAVSSDPWAAAYADMTLVSSMPSPSAHGSTWEYLLVYDHPNGTELGHVTWTQYAHPALGVCASDAALAAAQGTLSPCVCDSASKPAASGDDTDCAVDPSAGGIAGGRLQSIFPSERSFSTSLVAAIPSAVHRDSFAGLVSPAAAWARGTLAEGNVNLTGNVTWSATLSSWRSLRATVVLAAGNVTDGDAYPEAPFEIARALGVCAPGCAWPSCLHVAGAVGSPDQLCAASARVFLRGRTVAEMEAKMVTGGATEVVDEGGPAIQFVGNAHSVSDIWPIAPLEGPYELEGWFKSVGPGGASRLYFGVAPTDKDGQYIFHQDTVHDSVASRGVVESWNATHLFFQSPITGWRECPIPAYYRVLAIYPDGDDGPNSLAPYRIRIGSTQTNCTTYGAWGEIPPDGMSMRLNFDLTPYFGDLIANVTVIRNTYAGGTYMYIAAGYAPVPNQWTRYSAIIGPGMGHTTSYAEWRSGTRGTRILLLNNYQQTTDFIVLARGIRIRRIVGQSWPDVPKAIFGFPSLGDTTTAQPSSSGWALLARFAQPGTYDRSSLSPSAVPLDTRLREAMFGTGEALWTRGGSGPLANDPLAPGPSEEAVRAEAHPFEALLVEGRDYELRQRCVEAVVPSSSSSGGGSSSSGARVVRFDHSYVFTYTGALSQGMIDLSHCASLPAMHERVPCEVREAERRWWTLVNRETVAGDAAWGPTGTILSGTARFWLPIDNGTLVSAAAGSEPLVTACGGGTDDRVSGFAAGHEGARGAAAAADVCEGGGATATTGSAGIIGGYADAGLPADPSASWMPHVLSTQGLVGGGGTWASERSSIAAAAGWTGRNDTATSCEYLVREVPAYASGPNGTAGGATPPRSCAEVYVNSNGTAASGRWLVRPPRSNRTVLVYCSFENPAAAAGQIAPWGASSWEGGVEPWVLLAKFVQPGEASAPTPGSPAAATLGGRRFGNLTAAADPARLSAYLESEQGWIEGVSDGPPVDPVPAYGHGTRIESHPWWHHLEVGSAYRLRFDCARHGESGLGPETDAISVSHTFTYTRDKWRQLPTDASIDDATWRLTHRHAVIRSDPTAVTSPGLYALVNATTSYNLTDILAAEFGGAAANVSSALLAPNTSSHDAVSASGHPLPTRGWDPLPAARLFLPYARSHFPTDPTASYGLIGTAGPLAGLGSASVVPNARPPWPSASPGTCDKQALPGWGEPGWGDGGPGQGLHSSSSSGVSGDYPFAQGGGPAANCPLDPSDGPATLAECWRVASAFGVACASGHTAALASAAAGQEVPADAVSALYVPGVLGTSHRGSIAAGVAHFAGAAPYLYGRGGRRLDPLSPTGPEINDPQQAGSQVCRVWLRPALPGDPETLPPVVTAVTPSTVAPLGGATITVEGRNFAAQGGDLGVRVFVPGAGECTGVAVNAAGSSITCIAPAGRATPGGWPVLVRANQVDSVIEGGAGAGTLQFDGPSVTSCADDRVADVVTVWGSSLWPHDMNATAVAVTIDAVPCAGPVTLVGTATNQGLACSIPAAVVAARRVPVGTMGPTVPAAASVSVSVHGVTSPATPAAVSCLYMGPRVPQITSVTPSAVCVRANATSSPSAPATGATIAPGTTLTLSGSWLWNISAVDVDLDGSSPAGTSSPVPCAVGIPSLAGTGSTVTCSLPGAPVPTSNSLTSSTPWAVSVTASVPTVNPGATLGTVSAGAASTVTTGTTFTTLTTVAEAVGVTPSTGLLPVDASTAAVAYMLPLAEWLGNSTHTPGVTGTRVDPAELFAFLSLMPATVLAAQADAAPARAAVVVVASPFISADFVGGPIVNSTHPGEFGGAGVVVSIAGVPCDIVSRPGVASTGTGGGGASDTPLSGPAGDAAASLVTATLAADPSGTSRPHGGWFACVTGAIAPSAAALPVTVTDVASGCETTVPGGVSLPVSQIPLVTAVTPASGGMEGGWTLTISGSALGVSATDLTEVALVPVPDPLIITGITLPSVIPCSTFAWVSTTRITCTTPAVSDAQRTATLRWAVAVTTGSSGASTYALASASGGGGSATLSLSVTGADAVVYSPVAITSVSPTSGSRLGGAVLTIHGSSLDPRGSSTSVTLSCTANNLAASGASSFTVTCATVPTLGAIDGTTLVCVTGVSDTEALCTVAVSVSRGAAALPTSFTLLPADTGAARVVADVIDASTSEWSPADTASVVLRLLAPGSNPSGAAVGPVTITLAVDRPGEAELVSASTVTLASTADIAVVTLRGVDDEDPTDGDAEYHLVGTIIVSSASATANVDVFAPVLLVNRGQQPVLESITPDTSPLLGTDMMIEGANFVSGSIVVIDGVDVGNVTIVYLDGDPASSSNGTANSSTAPVARRASWRDANAVGVDLNNDDQVHHRRQQHQQQEVQHRQASSSSSSSSSSVVTRTRLEFSSPQIPVPGYKHVELVDPSNTTVLRESWVYYTDACPEPGQLGTGLTCRPCPTGAICPGGERIMPERGYWSPSEGSGFVVECTVEEACPGCVGLGPRECYAQPLCTVPYVGYACDACLDGFFRNPGGLCQPCPEPDMFYTMIVVNTAIWVLVALCVAVVEDREALSHIVALVLVLQEIGGIGQGVSSKLPKWSYEMYEWIYLASGDVSFLKPDCLGQVQLELEFLISIAYSIGLLVPVLLSVVIARTISLARHRSHGEDVLQERRSHYDARLVRAGTIWVTLVYFTLTQRSFQVMSCLSFGGEAGDDAKRITTQREYVCYSTGHIIANALAGVIVLCVTVGWPALNWHLMRRRDDETLYEKPEYQLRWDLLYEPYKPKLRYGFIVDFAVFAVIALSSTLLVQHPRTQYLVAGGGFTAVIIYLCAARPYRRAWENALVAGVMVANLVASTVIFLSHSFSEAGTRTLTYVLVGVVGIVLVTHAGIAVYALFFGSGAASTLGPSSGKKKHGKGNGDDDAEDPVQVLFGDDPAAALLLAMGDGHMAAAGEVFGEPLEEVDGDEDGGGGGGIFDSVIGGLLSSPRGGNSARVPRELLDLTPPTAGPVGAPLTAKDVMPEGFVPLFHVATPRCPGAEALHRHEPPSVTALLLAMVGLGPLAPPSYPSYWDELPADGSSGGSRVDVTAALRDDVAAVVGRRVVSVHLNADRTAWAAYAAEVASLRDMYARDKRAVPRYALATHGTDLAQRLALMGDVAETLLFAANDMGSVPALEQGPLGRALYTQEHAPEGGVTSIVLCRVLVGCPYAAVRPVTEATAPPCRFGHAGDAAGMPCDHATFDSAMTISREHDPRSFLPTGKPRSVAVYNRARVFPELFVRVEPAE